jgi:predicted RNase H-like HicB family nuclease
MVLSCQIYLGVFSAGSTIEEAMQNAHEAIECHLEGLLLDNESIPFKKAIEQHLENPDFKEGVLAVVEIDLSKISGKTTRINISIPQRFLKQIDDYTHQHGGNRSGFLVDAAMTYMAEH